MKRSPLDILFSKYIRTRDKWTCQRCFKEYKPPTKALDCSHYHGRAKKSVRFDEMNCCTQCRGCHSWLTAHPEEHRNFVIKRIGQKQFDLLMIRANTSKRPDIELLKIYYKAKLKEFDNDILGKKA